MAALSANKVFKFVSSEMLRFQRELNAGNIRNFDFTDIFSTIPGERGMGRTIGRQADLRLRDLARQIIDKNDDLKNHIDSSDLVAAFKKELSKEIVATSDRTAGDIVSDSLAAVRSKFSRHTTYFIPCILPRHSRIIRFRIGKILFHKKDRLLDRLRDEITDDQIEMYNDLIDQKDLYNWIAEISLNGFSSERGRERAYLLVRLAIAGFKACFTEKFGKWLGTDEQLMPTLLNYHLARDEGMSPCVGWSRQFILNSSDDSIDEIFHSNRSNWFKLLGSFLDQQLERGDFGFLGNRIISALTWLDVGTSPSVPAQRIIAYSNCLEALFVTEDRGQREQICKRAVPILKVININTDWDTKIRELYHVRSELVHGARSPVDSPLKQSVYAGASLANSSVMGSIYFCVWLLEKYPVNKTKPHLSPFNGRGSFSKVIERELPLFVEDMKPIQAADEEVSS